MSSWQTLCFPFPGGRIKGQFSLSIWHTLGTPYRDSRGEFSGHLGRREVSLHQRLHLGKTYVVLLVDSTRPVLPRFTKEWVSLSSRQTSQFPPYRSSTLEQICGFSSHLHPSLSTSSSAVDSREFPNGDKFHDCEMAGGITKGVSYLPQQAGKGEIVS